jgi:hypothetical protein
MLIESMPGLSAARVVHDLGAAHLQARVAVGPGIELGRPEEERRPDRPAGIERSGPLEAEHTVTDQLRPDSEVAASGQFAGGNVGDLPDAEL